MIDQKAIAAAIAFLESHREGYGAARAMAKANGAMRSTITNVEDMIANIETSIDALRECAERREGCEYCTPEPNERVELQCLRIGRTSWVGYETSGCIECIARFCPMCGRKLERGEA